MEILEMKNTMCETNKKNFFHWMGLIAELRWWRKKSVNLEIDQYKLFNVKNWERI